MHQNDDLPPLPDQLSGDIKKIIIKLLEKDPVKRYQTSEEVLEDLNSIDLKTATIVTDDSGKNYYALDKNGNEAPVIKKGDNYIFKDQESNWQPHGLDTQVFSEGPNWGVNPYKSQHYAETFMCIPAMVYNMRKDRQIKCMYKNCLQKRNNAGMSTGVCDTNYKLRQCLYVESAQFKKHGYSKFFDNALKAIITQIPWLVAGTVYSELCSDYSQNGDTKECTKAAGEPIASSGAKVVACGLIGTATTIQELISMSSSIYKIGRASCRERV